MESDSMVPVTSNSKQDTNVYIVLQIKCCLADFLLERNQSKLCPKLKKQIVELNEARPDMRIKSQFRPIVPNCPWLVGSCKLNKLFCFVCLLSHISSHGKWSKGGWGPSDTNLAPSIELHGHSIKHIQNVLTIWRFDKPKAVIMSHSNENSKTAEVEHNKKVKRNRDLMKRFIDTVALMAKQRVPLGHNEKDDSNCGYYAETLQYLREYDAFLDSQLQQCSPEFAGLSTNTQNDIIHSIASVVRDAIKHEMSHAHFVAAMIEETNDTQMTAVVRYATESGIEERFLGLFDASGNDLLKILEEYECKGKMAGQCYGVLSEEKARVQAKLLQDSPIVVPSNAHSFNLVLSRSLENVPPFNVFFGTVRSIVSFFNRFPKCSQFLKEIVDSEMPGVYPIDWEYNSRSVSVVFYCRSEIVHTFKTMLDSNESLEWDSEAILLAESLLKKLQDMQFCFILHVLAEIFETTDILDDVLRTKDIDMVSAKQKIDSFSSWLSLEFTNKFPSIYESVYKCCEGPKKYVPLNKRDMNTLKAYQITFIGIIKNIQTNIEYRYRAFSQMSFLDLLNKSKYAQFKDTFPRKEVRDLLTKFPGKFEFTTLQHELIVYYRTSSLNKLELFQLYSHLRSSELRDTFPQTVRLCELSLALPLTTKFTEQSFSKSKLPRLNTYIADTRKEEMFNDWALICVENGLLLKLKENINFYDTVLKYFVKRNKKLALEYIENAVL